LKLATKNHVSNCYIFSFVSFRVIYYFVEGVFAYILLLNRVQK